jgi:DNA mismatch endonuclease, patch repair protein
MADVFSAEKRSEVMRQIRSKDTRAEIVIHQALRKLGLRFKLHDKKLPGKPDVVFPLKKLAIQVRGCFWHGHTCIDGHQPKSRRSYWGPKLLGNIRRDRRNDRKLRRMGWRLLNIWECQCHKKGRLGHVLKRITIALTNKKSTRG